MSKKLLTPEELKNIYEQNFSFSMEATGESENVAALLEHIQAQTEEIARQVKGREAAFKQLGHVEDAYQAARKQRDEFVRFVLDSEHCHCMTDKHKPSKELVRKAKEVLGEEK